MVSNPDSSRREFLTGRAVQKEIRRLGDEFIDALDESETGPSAPTAGDTVRLGTKAMGCPWCVIMNPGPPRQVMAASDAFDVVRDVEELLTIYRDDSETAYVNQEAVKGPVSLSSELMNFLNTCQEIYADTEGAFDPTSGKLIKLWNATRLSGRIPFPGEIEEALAQSGMNHVHLDQATSSVEFDAEVLLDFASIGKGEGIDQAAQHITNEEITNFLLHGGHSSLCAAGVHQNLDGWPVGLKNPLFTEKRYATILLKDCGMSTSGSNVQYFRFQGKRYGHLLDPRTGWPAKGMLSVTVIAPTACEADALSTAFYVMGLEKTLIYCENHPEIGAILIPALDGKRLLQPVVKNFPMERLFFEEDVEIPRP